MEPITPFIHTHVEEAAREWAVEDSGARSAPTLKLLGPGPPGRRFEPPKHVPIPHCPPPVSLARTKKEADRLRAELRRWREQYAPEAVDRPY